jgi:hypothetical protein
MQHDYIISNQSGSGFRSDLNSALSAIATQNSGSTAPSTTYAYELWADTTTGILKRRNAANSAWIDLGTLDGGNIYASYIAQRVDNSQLTLNGGSTGGANIELNGPSSGSASNAFYDASQHYLRSVDGVTQYGRFHANGLDVGAASAADAYINVGAGATGNRYAYLDLIGDTTYTDYGLRIIRSNTGANTSSNIQHRGAGYLSINAEDAGYVSIGTNGSIRIEVNPTGLTTVNNGLSGAVTRSTAVATTSGTSVSFTSLPSWVKRISIHLSGVSLSGTDHLLVRLSTGGTFAATGYLSGVNYTDGVAATVGTGTTSTAGYAIGAGNASNIQTGTYTFTNITGNTWIGTYVGTYDNDARYVAYGAGKVTLGGILDGIRLLPTGSNTFDAGTVNITYEG